MKQIVRMKRIFTSFLITKILLICVPLYLFPQQFNFKKYSVADGLGSSTINHIFQDSRGYIWFATQGGGVSRFNGKEFKNFTKSAGLINNDVTYITEDRSGNIWLGTTEGISCFNGNAFTNYKIPDGVVYSLYADAGNKIWVATKGGGVKIFNDGKFDSLTTRNGLPSNEVYSVIGDKEGNYWFGLSNGVAKYKSGKITRYAENKIAGDKTFFCSFSDSKGNVWFGSTSGEVIIFYPDNTLKKLELPPPCRHDFIGGIAEDKRNNIWLGTDHGLLKYDGKEFKLFSEREGLSVNTVQAVMCDYENNVWAGTLTGSANLLSSEAFVHYSDKEGLSSRNVTAIATESAGKTYYVATGEGLFIFESLTSDFRKISGIKELTNSNVTSVSVDKDELLWLSTVDKIFVLERRGDEFSLRKEYSQLAGHRIVSPTKIIHTKDGNTWIATYGSGAFFFKKNSPKDFDVVCFDTSKNILTVFEDSKKNIWLGTQDAGLIRYDGKMWEYISRSRNFPDKAIWAVEEDDKGNIFFGTGESGLCLFDGKEIKKYATTDGLVSNYISSLLWDKSEKCLWAGSEKGLEKLKFTASSKIGQITSYKEQDGFTSIGINHGAIWQDTKGLLWLGTVDGLWRYNSGQDFNRNTSPKIQLTGIRMFYQKTDWKKYSDSIDSRTNLPVHLSLPYNKNHLTFDIQALTVFDVSYVFRLEGQDKEWSQPVENNAVTYTNISPGEYVFKAHAINSEGVSGGEMISISFVVNPPWWNTWWFRLIILTAVIASLVVFIKTREKVLKEQNLKLEETVKQRTKEIAHQKEIVEETLKEKEILLKEIHHRVKNNLQTISSMLMLQSAGLKDEEAKKAITESQNRVSSIALVHQKLYQTDGLEKVELYSFINDLTKQIKSIYREKSDQVNIHINIPETYLLIDTAIPLGLIFNELITNSFKYAFNGHTKCEIRIELLQLSNSPVRVSGKKNFRLIYKDSGPGLKSKEIIDNASTLGLRLIKLLSKQIGAELNYSNIYGSEFIFTFGKNI